MSGVSLRVFTSITGILADLFLFHSFFSFFDPRSFVSFSLFLFFFLINLIEARKHFDPETQQSNPKL